MTKIRQDAWSHEDDLLLAETVLRHVREGSTQLIAFEEVGDKLNRTGAACGFRWNAIVRKKYEQAIEIAKKQRKQRKRAELQRRTRNWQTPPTVVQTYSEAEEVIVTQTETSQSQPDDDTSTVEINPLNPLTMSDVIYFLENLQINDRSSKRLSKENQLLQQQNETLELRTKDLEKQLEKLKDNYQTVEEDYQSLIGIMDRARRMVAFQDHDESTAPAFKMDKNGNLEKIAK